MSSSAGATRVLLLLYIRVFMRHLASADLTYVIVLGNSANLLLQSAVCQPVLRSPPLAAVAPTACPPALRSLTHPRGTSCFVILCGSPYSFSILQDRF